MPPAQVAHIMSLVEAYADSTHISSHENCLAARAAVEAALRDAPQAEPVHWRALLDPVQRPQKLQTHHHVVGFTSLKACEAFVASELDMNGWRYTIEPLYNRPPATPSAPTAVEHKPLFAEMIAQHPGLREEMLAEQGAPTAVEPDERAKRDKQHRDLFFAAYHLLDGVCEDHPALADVLNVDAHGALCHALAQLDVFYGINGPEDIAPPIKAEPGSRLEYELHVLNSKASASKGTPL